MNIRPRYSIKKYMLILVVSTTVGVITTAVMLGLAGFDSQGILVVVLFSFPLWLFSVLYGFYKGLVKYYDLKGSEKLFFGGRF
jgi:hypothetical protein